jgi:phenylacetic acid degradation operon negative regulatory protein
MSIRRNLLSAIKGSEDYLEIINGVRYLPYRLLWGSNLQSYDKKAVQTVLSRAVKTGLVRKRIRKEQVYLALTKLGEELLKEIKVKSGGLDLKRSTGKWDGFYRIISFDIPEKDRIIRDHLRSQLQLIGAVGWQKSLWVTKENITGALNDFILENNLGDYLLVVEVKEIYNSKLKKLLE